MTKILNTQQQIDEFASDAVNAAKEKGFDLTNDDIDVVQTFDDGQAMLLSVEGIGQERKTNLKVLGELIFLPKREGTLDMFEEDNDDK